MMNQEQWLGLLRDFLKIVGTILVAKGAMSVVDWSTYTGLILTAAPMAWGMYEKTKARMVAKVNALPEVAGVVTTHNEAGTALADAVDSAAVAPAGTNQAMAVAKAVP